MPNQRRVLIAACIAAAAIVRSSPAFCDFIIVGSESPKFVVGQTFSDSAEIEIEDQDQVRVMDQSSGETKLLEGPYKGTITEYRACQSGERTSGACSPARRAKPVGGTRALRQD
jgi:hypothetical protein